MPFTVFVLGAGWGLPRYGDPLMSESDEPQPRKSSRIALQNLSNVLEDVVQPKQKDSLLSIPTGCCYLDPQMSSCVGGAMPP